MGVAYDVHIGIFAYRVAKSIVTVYGWTRPSLTCYLYYVAFAAQLTCGILTEHLTYEIVVCSHEGCIVAGSALAVKEYNGDSCLTGFGDGIGQIACLLGRNNQKIDSLTDKLPYLPALLVNVVICGIHQQANVFVEICGLLKFGLQLGSP